MVTAAGFGEISEQNVTVLEEGEQNRHTEMAPWIGLAESLAMGTVTFFGIKALCETDAFAFMTADDTQSDVDFQHYGTSYHEHHFHSTTVEEKNLEKAIGSHNQSVNATLMGYNIAGIVTLGAIFLALKSKKGIEFCENASEWLYNVTHPAKKQNRQPQV
jgi:hypothetical protein